MENKNNKNKINMQKRIFLVSILFSALINFLPLHLLVYVLRQPAVQHQITKKKMEHTNKEKEFFFADQSLLIFFRLKRKGKKI